jgi:hypothetical protein
MTRDTSPEWRIVEGHDAAASPELEAVAIALLDRP